MARFRWPRRARIHCSFGSALAGALLLVGGLLVADTVNTAQAQISTDPPAFPATLKGVKIPEPPDLAEYVVDRQAAVQLGKALFWDMQVGGDGVTACATCHFVAGADNRSKNQVSPGLLGSDQTFQVGGPNFTLRPSDFPLHRLADPTDRQSAVLADANDVISSQGVFLNTFGDVDPTTAIDQCRFANDTVFHIGPVDDPASVNTRRVEPRNTPSVVNAVFNFRNFWDGRANNEFNGVSPFGRRDTNASVWKVENGLPREIAVAIQNSSLASQAVGPPNSPFEMSCGGRGFLDIGRKLLAPGVRPLAKQLVEPTDSVLGAPLARWNGDPALISQPSVRGIDATYGDMIARAFNPAYWSAPDPVTIKGAAYTQKEANFSLFFGLAVQLYEATLVSDDTPFDRFVQGDAAALSPQQVRGLVIFGGQGMCANCHSGAELSGAVVQNVTTHRLERMHMADDGVATYDNGFYNIGVRPSGDDVGVGGTDPFGNPLSETGYCQQQLLRGLTCPADVLNVVGRPLEDLDPTTFDPTGRIAVRGNFKVPQLRNVELTAPYFHNGGQASLRQVVEFYSRGGDFADQNRNDLDPDIRRLGLTDQQKDDLVAFLVGLTDERVRLRRAPFDHPELLVPNGHIGDDLSVRTIDGNTAADDFLRLAPVGAAGASTPLKMFMATDTDPPTISAVTVGIADLRAGVEWSTDDIADSQVEYGLTATYGFSTTLDRIRTTSHRQLLTGLAPSTTYHYRVKSRDAAGNLTVSPDATFETAPPPAVAALAFNGTNNYVEVMNKPDMDISGPLTVEAWIKPRSASGHRHALGTTKWELAVEPDGPGFRVIWDLNTGVTRSQVASGPLALDRWYHVAATYDRATMRLFVDGAEVGSLAAGGSVPRLTGPMRIGTVSATDDVFDGLVDEVRLSDVMRYTGAFTPLRTPFPPDTNTRGLWHLSEGSGITTLDSTGSGNVGELMLEPLWTTDSPVGLIDSTAPTLSSLAVGQVSRTGATVTWTTNRAADTAVDYGPTASYGSTTLTQTGTALVTTHSQTLIGLTPGTLYHLRARSTDAFGIAGASANLTLTTLPPDVTAPTISALSVAGITMTDATVSWTTDEASTSLVEYGLTAQYGSSTEPGSALVTSHSQALGSALHLVPQLLPGTTYHYRVKSVDEAGNVATSPDATLTTTARPTTFGPGLAAFGPVDPRTGFPSWYEDASGIRLEPCLTSATQCLFPTPNLTQPPSVPGNFPDEALYFAAEATMPTSSNGIALLAIELVGGFTNGAFVQSDAAVFSRIRVRVDNLTPGATYTITHPYGVETLVAGLPGPRGINFTEDIGCFGVARAPCDFRGPLLGRIGPFLTWDGSLPAPAAGFSGDITVPHRVVGSPFGSNVFRVEGPNVGGPGINRIETDLFVVQGKLASRPAPTIKRVQDDDVTPANAVVSWTTDEPADSQIEYGPTTAYGSTTGVDSALKTSHSLSINGLAPNTTYHYRVKSKNSAGIVAVSADFTLKTPAAITLTVGAPTAPVISNVNVIDNTGRSVTITWASDRLADGQVEYGLDTSYGSVVPVDTDFLMGHAQTLINLNPNTTYHFRVRSRGVVGAKATSADFTFTTGTPVP